MSAEGVFSRAETGAISITGRPDILDGTMGTPGVLSLKVVGSNHKNRKKGLKAAPAILCAVLLLVILLASVIISTLSPVHLLREIQAATNTMSTDAKESMALIFQEFLRMGIVPEMIVRNLTKYNILVGYQNGTSFIPSSSGKIEVATTDTSESYDKREPLSIKMGDKIISADDFYYEVNHNPRLYEAFINATCSEAAYYYDESARNVFQRIGTNRNNFSGDDDFEEVMNKLMGEGSDIDINNVILVEKEDDDGEKYYIYETLGAAVDSGEEDFTTAVAKKSLGKNTTDATLNAASTLAIADKISQEQRAALYYLGMAEIISKMQAGDGGDNVPAVMRYLNEDGDSLVVDVNTGEVKTISGNAMDAPSITAITTNSRVDVDSVKDYSSNRILDIVENKIGVNNSGAAISTAVTSATSNVRGTISRYVDSGSVAADSDVVNTVSPIINASLQDNTFDSISGIARGETLINGAVVVERELAGKSGATMADDAAVKSYMDLNNQVLALEAEVDRMNRSPLDITSENTFLGNIVHKLAVGIKSSGTTVNRISSLFSVVGKSVATILPTTHADDENNSYLTNFGDCEISQNIGAVSSATCAEIAVFDTTTLEGIFDDKGFERFVEENTELKNGERVVKQGSYLAKFIINNERMTPNGVVDGGILTILKDGLSRIPFMTDIASSVKSFTEASESDKRIASGAAFVNSSSNADWAIYKYAQRYVSLERAKSAMQQFSGDDVAYDNLRYLEGDSNPIIAFLNEYYQIASK